MKEIIEQKLSVSIEKHPLDEIRIQITSAYLNGDKTLERIPDCETKRIILSCIDKIKAIKDGDEHLSQFEDSIEKKIILEYVPMRENDFKSNESYIVYLFSCIFSFLTSRDLDDLQSLKEKLKEASYEEKVSIILDIIDNYRITSEVKEICKEYKEILLQISTIQRERILNKDKK